MTSFNMDDFGEYGNNTSEKAVTSGDAAKHIHGNTYTYQIGNATTKQIGNKNIFLRGYSNTLTEGMTFATSLAATFTTTVGMSVSTTVGLAIASHLGAKVAVFGGLEASVNASRAVKVLRGDAYTFGKTETLQTDAEIQAAKVSLKIANQVKTIIEDGITLASKNLTKIVAGPMTIKNGSRDITCLTSYTLTSPAMTLNGPTSLTAATGGDLTLTSGTLKMLGLTASMNFLGLIKLG